MKKTHKKTSNIEKYNAKRKAEKDKEIAEDIQEDSTPSDKALKRLQNDLVKLSGKCVREIAKLLKDKDKRIRLQAAGLGTRSALLALGRDALSPGAPSISITTIGQATVSQDAPLDPTGQDQGQHPKRGQPILVVK